MSPIKAEIPMTKPKNEIRVCIAQINYHSQNIHKHVDRIKSIITRYKTHDLIVFPELLLHGHPSFEKPEGFLYRKMKVMYSAVSKDLYRFVKNLNAGVIIGELKRWGEKYYNVATYINQLETQSYVKTHVHWTENFVPGKELKVFDSPFGKMGINICFDAAFSETWRVLSLKGAELMVNISAVPKAFPSEYMWRRFAGAAINNQAFVIYANRPRHYFSGHSAVFNPKGEVLVSAGSEEAIIETTLDLDEVRQWRMEEAIFPNRRPLLYREIGNRHKDDFVAYATKKAQA